MHTWRVPDVADFVVYMVKSVCSRSDVDGRGRDLSLHSCHGSGTEGSPKCSTRNLHKCRWRVGSKRGARDAIQNFKKGARDAIPNFKSAKTGRYTRPPVSIHTHKNNHTQTHTHTHHVEIARSLHLASRHLGISLLSEHSQVRTTLGQRHGQLA